MRQRLRWKAKLNLWTTRESALEALRTDMVCERELLDKAFQQLEYFAQRLGDIKPETPFTQSTALVAAKARNLAQASYSLVLDGLGQEAGAIVRVWIETTELLIYIRRRPEKAGQILKGNLPSAGMRAKLIESATQSVRTFLSETASHFKFAPNSWLHVVDERTGRVRTRQEVKHDVLRENLGTNFALLIWTIKEAALCLNDARGSIEGGIVRQWVQLRNEGFALFNANLDISMPAED